MLHFNILITDLATEACFTGELSTDLLLFYSLQFQTHIYPYISTVQKHH